MKQQSNATPLAVISCQRPFYLRETLLGIKASCELSEFTFNVRLFQDVPPSGKSKSDQVLKDCVNIFRDIFPGGTFDVATKNIGIAANFQRAERWAYSPENCRTPIEAALFFEEDFVPSKTAIPWITSMLKLGLVNPYQIGAVSAAGHLHGDDSDLLTPMGQLWAYAITKKAYNKIVKKLNQYDKLAIEFFDKEGVHHPPLDMCLALAVEWGFEPQASSRDSFIAMALHCEEFLQIAPNGVHGQYIGIDGLNTSQELFEQSEWCSVPKVESEPLFEQLKIEIKRRTADIRNHQERQFMTLHQTYYTEACREAYQSRRFKNAVLIAERGLTLFGSQSCKWGHPFHFERQRIKGLVWLDEHDKAIDYCNQLILATHGSWPLWALAAGFEETGNLDMARHTWQFIVDNYQSADGSAQKAYAEFLGRCKHPDSN